MNELSDGFDPDAHAEAANAIYAKRAGSANRRAGAKEPA